MSKLLIGHKWRVPYQQEPIQMYGYFDSLDAFCVFCREQELKWDARIVMTSSEPVDKEARHE